MRASLVLRAAGGLHYRVAAAKLSLQPRMSPFHSRWMKSAANTTIAVAIFAFASAGGGFCQDHVPDIASDEQSLAEAYAAGNGISISMAARDWDDIPLVPFPKGLQQEPDSLAPVSFTLSLRFQLTMRSGEPRALLMRNLESIGVPLLTRTVADLVSVRCNERRL